MPAELNFIGRIQTPYKSPEECPRQPQPEDGYSQIILDHDYVAALTGLKAGDAIQVLYWFDQADRNILKIIPFWSETQEEHGVFSIRSPHRPNPIALSTVEIVSIDQNIVTINAIDCASGTPLLDIKPYIQKQP